MSKRIFIGILSIILIINTIIPKNVYAEEEKRSIKVGVFYLEPYAYLNSDGDIAGYYIELFDLLSKKMNVEVEYVLTDLNTWVANLENGYVDIILGSSINEERAELYTYNKYSIALEGFAIYTNKDINSSNFDELNGLRFGYVESSDKAEWIFNFFNAVNVKFIPVPASGYNELEELMDENKIDLMIDSAYKNSKYDKIYEFLGNQVFVCAKNDNKDLLYEVDKAMEEYQKEDKDLIRNLYNSYFDQETSEINKKIKKTVISFFIIILLFLFVVIIPRLKMILKKRVIKRNLEKDRYLLYYQPIYNPILDNIVGFEGLLRLKDKNDKIISPAKFIPEIEKNKMLFTVSLWILKKAIADFKQIKDYKYTENENIYISINLSIDEIQNNKFVDEAIRILSEGNLQPKSICLEIVERVRVGDLPRITNNINKLKKAGFKIAIDDFGSEYANLDILEKLDVDIIKVDKDFVDGIGKDLVKDETISFIFNIANKCNKDVVLEGIETRAQHEIVKKFNMSNVFVQGYFYGKPVEKNKLKVL